MKKNLTIKEIEVLIAKALKENKRQFINCGGGLFVRVQSNSIPYSVRIKDGNKDTKVIIGYYPRDHYKDMRLKANELQGKRKELIASREDVSNLPKFNEFFLVWIGEKSKQLKANSNRPNNLKSLYKNVVVASGIDELKLDKITAKEVCCRLSELKQTDGNKHNALLMLHQCLNSAYAKGVIPFNPLTDLLRNSENPFKKPKAVGFKTISPNEIFDKYFIPLKNCPLINKVFYLYICLTGFRFGECRFLRWEYCDFENEVIVIPADAELANKTQTEYTKPMTKQIKSLLMFWKNKADKNTNTGFVFSSTFNENKAICEGSLREPLKALTSRELDFHGLRKVLRTWLSTNKIPVHIAELAIQHNVRSALEKIYDKNKYQEEIRDALQLWNNYIESGLPTEFLELINTEIGD